MTRKRLLLLVIGAAVLSAWLYAPLCTAWSRLQGEPFYAGKPASYWARELATWKEGMGCTGPKFDRWHRPASTFDIYVWKYLPRPWKAQPKPRILAGDEAALPVLVALLSADSPQVRRIAVEALSELKAKGLSALRKAVNDPDEAVGFWAQYFVDIIEGRDPQWRWLSPEERVRYVAARLRLMAVEGLAALKDKATPAVPTVAYWAEYWLQYIEGVDDQRPQPAEDGGDR